jgi:3-oxoacyl-ACP reductase-like protein
MKKPKDVTDLASRLASAAATPLVAPAPAPIAPAAVEAAPAVLPEKRRKAPNRATVPVFLRISQMLYEQCDEEAVRRTKQTGRGVTVQQVILDRLAGARA